MAIINLLPLNYRRPALVERPATSASQVSTQQSEEGSVNQGDTSLKSIRSGSSGGIPPPLSFDRIIEGGTCPPCTVRDFMNYLIYVERSAENLQFFLWYRDFEKRFNEAQTADLTLAPEWTLAMEEEAVARIKKEQAEKARVKPPKSVSPAVAEIFKGTDFEKPIQKPSVATTIATTPISPLAASNGGDPFGTPPRTPSDRGHHYPNSNTATTYNTAANEAFALAGLKAPFTVQPFRVELNRIIVTYIMSGSPRQLNLSDREQKAVLQALCFTTHPSALRVVVRSVESTLRQQAHPNFIRWSICNGNPVRVTFARCLGVGTIALSTIAAIILTLSSAPRGFRALPAIGWVIGVATLVAAYKGMCVVLHGLHHRHVRPWELFAVDGEDHQQNEKEQDVRSEKSLETGSNSFENEPWVVKYEKRNLIRKIFDREVWIQEPALRQIQDTIFVQSLLFAFICAGGLTAIFVPLPGGNLF
ncbi:hypothetical protein QC763_114510 [Podospora pseudopauciseta]|uniref:RGS domain-containing protein n=1 Tax=Podospora pseudopauciseta TaxID=2093780 RepID=A0ABR0I075_9PEZI|nr:hypothetical protein QC763_114510 [Podospora pseudopauciseta]